MASLSGNKKKGFLRRRLLLLASFIFAACFVFYRWWTLSFGSKEWILLVAMNGLLLLAGVYLIVQWYRQDGSENGDGASLESPEAERVRVYFNRLEKYLGNGEMEDDEE